METGQPTASASHAGPAPPGGPWHPKYSLKARIGRWAARSPPSADPAMSGLGPHPTGLRAARAEPAEQHSRPSSALRLLPQPRGPRGPGLAPPPRRRVVAPGDKALPSWGGGPLLPRPHTHAHTGTHADVWTVNPHAGARSFRNPDPRGHRQGGQNLYSSEPPETPLIAVQPPSTAQRSGGRGRASPPAAWSLRVIHSDPGGSAAEGPTSGEGHRVIWHMRVSLAVSQALPGARPRRNTPANLESGLPRAVRPPGRFCGKLPRVGPGPRVSTAALFLGRFAGRRVCQTLRGRGRGREARTRLGAGSVGALPASVGLGWAPFCKHPRVSPSPVQTPRLRRQSAGRPSRSSPGAERCGGDAKPQPAPLDPRAASPAPSGPAPALP